MGPHLQTSPATRHVRRLTARALAWTCVAITTNVATKHHVARSTKAAMACHQPASARGSHWSIRPPPPPTHDYNPKISTGSQMLPSIQLIDPVVARQRRCLGCDQFASARSSYVANIHSCTWWLFHDKNT